MIDIDISKLFQDIETDLLDIAVEFLSRSTNSRRRIGYVSSLTRVLPKMLHPSTLTELLT
ncbi:4127_t:CDS:2 [Scutellospora calospora]|uniref:4127_t:CDS:1 n=1 Tax=Scutellospora calospora TaxID=85575 RepID=A0ACA9K9I8_9GLOM|nr:4127_t:CDS:2 [Scutellospora calospora]